LPGAPFCRLLFLATVVPEHKDGPEYHHAD
jgi:hypothetical protein